ncbi:alpha/beta hydrolase [Nonomuraea sp. NPDC050310]|uniref:alpha/beta hydrolase n=1 Tax=Nonomuraea sp. NPDC050310 TaxID=3154935 RepID=UPI00340168CC
MLSRVLLALACLFSLAAAARPASAGELPEPAGIEWSACPVRVPSGARCGFLIVPERRDAPDRTIKVGFARHMSTSMQRKPDPVVYTSGGPGSASLQLLGLLRQAFPDRDVIALEQRGSRWSEPSLGCPETAQLLLDELRARPSGAGSCLARLREEGVDPRGYTTAEIAADVPALRAALGYPQWNLFGVSYSTRSMLQAAALDPEGTRAVVLDSFLPEQVAWYDDAERNLLDTLTRLGLREQFDQAVRQADAHPIELPALDPVRGTSFTTRLTGDDLKAFLAEALHEAPVLAVAPVLVGALADGRTEVLRPLMDQIAPALVSHDWGLYHAVQCQDEVPFNAFPAEPRLFTVKVDRALCREWALPKGKPAKATTQAPVLVVGGELDPTTPPRTARPAAAALPNARFAEFPGVGHAVFLSGACGRRVIGAFVADPAAAAQPVGCAAPYERVGPEEVHLTAAPYRLLGTPWLGFPLALFALFSVLQLVAGGGRGWALTAFAGLSGLAFLGLSFQVLYAQFKTNQVVLGLGVPSVVARELTVLLAVSAGLSLLALTRRRGWPHLASATVATGFLLWWVLWML